MMHLLHLHLLIKVGENTTHEVKVDAENNTNLESEQTQININVIAQYPVANPGIGQTYVCGTEITLFGIRFQIHSRGCFFWSMGI